MSMQVYCIDEIPKISILVYSVNMETDRSVYFLSKVMSLCISLWCIRYQLFIFAKAFVKLNCNFPKSDARQNVIFHLRTRITNKYISLNSTNNTSSIIFIISCTTTRLILFTATYN